MFRSMYTNNRDNHDMTFQLPQPRQAACQAATVAVTGQQDKQVDISHQPTVRLGAIVGCVCHAGLSIVTDGKWVQCNVI